MDLLTCRTLFRFAILTAIAPRWTCVLSADIFLGVPMPDCSEYVCGNFTSQEKDHAHCECDPDCVIFGDCCYDVYTNNDSGKTIEGFHTHVSTYIEDRNLTDPLLIHWVNVVNGYGTCTTGLGYGQDEAYILISRCPDTTDDNTLVEKCEETSDDFLTEVPVSYTMRGIIHIPFRNIYCSFCHGVGEDQIEPWKVFVKDECVNNDGSKTIGKRILPFNNIKSSCIRIKEKPDLQTPLRFVCTPTVSSCFGTERTNQKQVTIGFICNSYILAIGVNISGIQIKYRNPHCIMCSSGRIPNETACAHLLPPLETPFPPVKKPAPNTGALFNFNYGLSVEINRNLYIQNKVLCEDNYIYDTILQTCIEIVCPDKAQYSDDGCIYDETSWSFITVPDNLKLTYRRYVISLRIEKSDYTTSDLLGYIQELLQLYGNISIDVSLSGTHTLTYDNDTLWTTPLDVANLIDDGLYTTTWKDKTTGETNSNAITTSNFKTRDTTSMSLTSLHRRMTTPLSTLSHQSDRNFTEQHHISNANDNANTNTNENMNKVEIIVGMSGQLGKIIGPIMRFIDLDSNGTISDIEVSNINSSNDCDIHDYEYVVVTNVMELNGSFFGIDNTSRVLVDIDMTEFKLNFTGSHISFAYLHFCRNSLLNCTMARYKIASFTLLGNGTLMHRTLKRQIEKRDYLIIGTDVLACIDMSAVTSEMVLRLLSSHEWLLSLIVESVSAVCLFVTSIVHCECFGIRTSNRLCILCLSLTLGIAQGLFLIQIDLPFIACKTKAIALHFFWVSSFLWMSVVGFDYAKTFRVDKTTLRHSSNTLCLKYMLFSYGVPFGFVAICVCIDELVPSLNIGYGVDGICWIGNQTAYRIVFALPVCIMILLNILFFICTVIGINRAKFTNSSSTTAQTRSFLMIYLKLCMIMGLTWVFGFVAGVVDNTVLWYCHIILNGLQGVNILLMFVLNKSTLQQLRKMNEKNVKHRLSLFRSKARSTSFI